MHKFLACVAISVGTMSGAAAQTAATPGAPGTKPAPLIDYLKPAQYEDPVLSPDGKTLLLSVPVNGRRNLAVLDLESRKGTALTNYGEFDVIDPRWVGNDRIVYTLGLKDSPIGKGQFNAGGLFMVSKDGKESKQLVATVKATRGSGANVYRGLKFLRRVPGSNEDILATGELRSTESLDVYRLNIVSGRSTLVSGDRPDRTVKFVLDRKLVPRVAVAWVKDTLTFTVHHRASADAPWREIERIDQTKADTFEPIGFAADDRTLLVLTNRGRETAAVYRYDPETRTLGEVVAQHPKYDLTASSANVEGETDRLIGFTVEADRPQMVWVDEKEGRTQATVDRALPGMFNTFSRFPNSSRVLITSRSDTMPERYYLLDESARTLEELFASKPWLGKDQLVEMRPFDLRTRDGLDIPSYYFLPKSYQPGQKLPMVVHIHGGPAVRADTWGEGFGYNEAQILASRGYAVVLPNFRLTPGLGSKIYRAGIGTWGRKMSEDHEDAVKWAVDQGFADPGRVCISGASYGGYAALRALAKTPDLFRCAVAGLVVSDFEMLISSTSGDTAGNPATVSSVHLFVGSQDSNRSLLRDLSPVHMAKDIKAPVFMYAGSDDVRTPLEQTTAMARALDRAGNPPKEVLVKKEEGHGYGRTENRVDLYEKMLKFLDENIGPNAKR